MHPYIYVCNASLYVFLLFHGTKFHVSLLSFQTERLCLQFDEKWIISSTNNILLILRTTWTHMLKRKWKTAFFTLKMDLNSRYTRNSLVKQNSCVKFWQAHKNNVVLWWKYFAPVQKKIFNILCTFFMMVKFIVTMKWLPCNLW